ncbi:MAG: sigma-54 interaction domain-containing protein [Halothiobacillus sp.]
MTDSPSVETHAARVLIFAPEAVQGIAKKLTQVLAASPILIEWELVGDAQSALFRLANQPHGLLLIVVEADPTSAFALWARCRSKAADLLGVMFLAEPKAATVRQAYQAGIADVLLLGDDTPVLSDLLEQALRRAEHTQRVNLLDYRARQEGLDLTLQPVAQSRAMRHALNLIHKVAPTPLPVLIVGETGTGKSVLARYIHLKSQRAERTFLTINCGALTPSLLESELFGHEKGAFTGANARRVGLLEVADGGTLFLDEINSAPMDLQVRLLQFIQEKRFLRVGGNQPINVDVRLIFASNKPLLDLVNQGQFREDLFYRINVFPVEIPPLRARVDDIAQIAGQTLLRACSQLNMPVKPCGPGVLEAVRCYPWPGNLRELDNVIQRGLIVSQGERVELADLPLEISSASRNSGATFVDAFAETAAFPWRPDARLDEVEQVWIQYVLKACNGNRTHAARQLGIDPSTLWRKLKEA